MRSWRTDAAAAFVGSLIVAACSSEYGLHTTNCGPEAFDTLEECKQQMLARGYSDSQAEIDAAAPSCCELTQDHHEQAGVTDCYPLKESSDCLGDTSADVKGDAGGGGAETLGVIGSNLSAVGATLDTAARLDSAREEMATEEVTDDAAALGEAAAATAKATVASNDKSGQRRGGTDASSGGTGSGILDFNSPPTGGSHSTGSGALSGPLSGLFSGNSAAAGRAPETSAARAGADRRGDDSGLVPALRGGGSGATGGGSGGTPDLPSEGNRSMEFGGDGAPPSDVPPMGSEDPSDYFERIRPHESLFKRIERKIDEKERLWMIQETLR